MLSLTGVLLAFSGVYFFDEKERLSVKEKPALQKKKKKQAKSRFACQGKTRCTQMRSCAEAKFYLRNCPGTKMDGDGDGIPCERQWCGR
ncbi:MAG: hypothetical protein D3909_08725 [Candidatus Electrothrix sp. ATG1]|nr:hypothetical protein [Candidatus Electrothrix sp. ATG1]